MQVPLGVDFGVAAQREPVQAFVVPDVGKHRLDGADALAIQEVPTKRSVNRATQALKLTAAALRSSKSVLGAYYRRMCARMDKGKAVTAAAHKLARLIYLMLTKGQEYTDQGQMYYEERYRERVVRNLNKKAAELGMQLVPCANPA